MQNLRPFQIGLLVLFGVIALISLVALAGYQGVGGLASNPYGERVTIWGTLDNGPFTTLLQDLSREDKNFDIVYYVEKDPRTFESELVNAIAEGKGPDAIILGSEDLVTFRTKLEPLSYDTFSERTLRDQYADGFEIFARPNGLYAIPLLIDPVLMYWNRDIFAGGGLSQPPSTWESLTDVTETLTLRDATRNLRQATVAFGEYENVDNAKAVILTLLLQSGSRMITEGNDRYQVALNTSQNNQGDPLFSTLQFYVEFNNVSSPLYSWNRTFESDRLAFLGERLALYFGYASEYDRLRQENPNLNFDAAAVPQGAGATVKRDYGQFYGLSILTSSSNKAGAYRASLMISSAAGAANLASGLGMAPAHRSSLGNAADPIDDIAFSQALIARGWLDPGSAESDQAFASMIGDIVSGRSSIGTAVSDTIRRLELAF